MIQKPLLTLAAALLVAVALGLSCGPKAGRGRSKRPHVVLVTLDTTRPDYFSCYGSRRSKTPNFDALAADGVRFERAVTTSALTPVSHATILTGTYSYQHELRVLWAGSGYQLPTDKETLATTLKRAGYATSAIHSAFPVSETFGFRRDFDHFDSFAAQPLRAEPDEKVNKVRFESRQRRSDATTDLVLAELDRLASLDQPFFLWIHYWDPHDGTILPPAEYLEGVQRGPEGQYHIVELYAAEVNFLDAQFGRMIAGLKERGLYDDTLLALTSDHGEGLDDGFRNHGWGKHRMLYREQLDVPLILRTPDGPRGKVISPLVRTVDITPTVLDYLGLESDVRFDGASLLPLVGGETEAEPRVAYADQINGYDHNAGMVFQRPDAAFMYALTDGEWKLIYRPHQPKQSELFHLPSDPEERENVWAAHPEVVERFLADLAVRNPWVLAPFPEPTTTNPALDDLGYQGGPVSETEWVWTCYRHPDYFAEERGRHDCGAILVPIKKP